MSSYDVVVVGAGIGGLTVAALLAARGLNICLLERQSQVGGCLSRVQFAGLDFEPGMGLYPFWGKNGIHQRIFEELPVTAPETLQDDSSFVVRLDDQTDIKLLHENFAFEAELKRVFPECAKEAIQFYSLVGKISDTWHRAQSSSTDASAGGIISAIRAVWPEANLLFEILRAREKTALQFALQTSDRFKAFVDAQLRALTNTSLETCGFLQASVALSTLREKLYSIRDGAPTLAERLAESIRRSGGTLRLNSAVLRLAYDKLGKVVGVDLLSGETVLANQAVVSNMTIWDTYGKLIGLNQTPSDVKKRLSTVEASGAYIVYAAMEPAALERLPSRRLVCGSQWPNSEESSISHFTFSAGAPNVNGQVPVTIKCESEVSDWFSFQANVDEYEEWDQAALEAVWFRVHQLLPQLGGDIEVIETASPRTFYEQTRRKLGMVLGLRPTADLAGAAMFRTSLPNVFVVGDTVSAAATIASVSHSALNLANELTR